MNRTRFRSPLVWAPTFGLLACIAAIVLLSRNEFVQRLCSTDFMPHGACYLWLPEILWLHVISDSTITLAYFLIPVGLIYFVTKRKGLRFRGVFWLFGAFILLCGMTHLLEIYSIWNAAYVLTGTVKFATGAVSLATAGYLIYSLPKALQIPFPEEMRQVQSHLRTETTVRQATQRELETRNRQFSAILKGGLDAFILVEANGDADSPHRILEINEQAEREIGYPREELLGQPLCDVFQRFAKLNLHDMLAETKRDSATLYREVEVEVASDRTRWLYIKSVPAGDAIAVFFADVSDQKWAETERRRMFERQTEAALKKSEASAARAQAALATATHGIIIVDTDGRIVETNKRLLAFFGYSEEELIGQPVELLVPESYRHSHRADRTQFHARPVERRMGSDRSLHARRKDGSEFPVEVGLNPFSTPDGDYVMASVLDITERVAARQALESKNEEIEQMVYAVSHDLKAPLVSIQGLASLLTDTDRIDDPETKSIVNEIDKSARQMRDLITDLLEMSRVGRVEETVEPVDIDVVVEDVRAMLGIQSDMVGCQWEVNGPFPVIRASRKRIVQLLQNLCSNALKYGCSGDERRIEIGSALSGAHFDIWVQDSGKGIEESQHAAVFKPFTRLDRHQDGTGIGLAIVTKIMKFYGGSAELRSSKGKGSRFTLRFPRSLLANPDTADTEQPQQPVASHPSAKPKSETAARPVHATAALREGHSEGIESLEKNYLTEFVYAAAHDLHAPMVTISGNLGFLQQVYAKELPDDAKRLLTHSIDASERMTDYVGLLVEFSGVLLAKRVFHNFDPWTACEEAIEALRPEIEISRAQIERTSHFPETIKADREMFVLLIRHLLSNSIKFVEAAQTPRIGLKANESRSHWQFTVSDQGIGISEANSELVFHPFQKLNRRTDYPGSGIGLTICRKIVESHNGSIWIDPDTPQGTTIHFTISK